MQQRPPGPPERGRTGPGRRRAGRRRVAEPPCLHRLRAVPRASRHRAGRPPPRALHRGPRGGALPRLLPPLALPPRALPPHRAPLRLHHLRLRRHQPRRRVGRLRQGVQGVPPRGLLHLAAAEGRERGELGQDPELPPGRQGLPEACGEEGDGRPVRQQQPLPDPGGFLVFLLAPDITLWAVEILSEFRWRFVAQCFLHCP